jgi:hypothetical protein
VFAGVPVEPTSESAIRVEPVIAPTVTNLRGTRKSLAKPEIACNYVTDYPGVYQSYKGLAKELPQRAY